MQVRNSNSVYKWSLNHASEKLLQWKKNKASFFSFCRCSYQAPKLYFKWTNFASIKPGCSVTKRKYIAFDKKEANLNAFWVISFHLQGRLKKLKI